MDVYAHPAPGYLRAEIDRLSFGAGVLVPTDAEHRSESLSPPSLRGTSAVVAASEKAQAAA